MEQQAAAISDAESKVMEVLWRSGSAMPAEDIVAALVSGHQWQEATIKSLLNRLLNKGALSAQKEGRRYLYTAVLKREHWLTSESTGLLERLFGGRIAPLVAHFGQHRKLSKTDIAELKRLIGELDDDQ
ncbi:BlaI/MecI/CopY family transcriptional regulator [Massilia sp. DJPM01]|uniref:BlaI/MecI/CopY family transcriptional regulator n=1 Tax=Massilia sp. DJPM01 TaxID=3024404 RepID=UPI00259E2173|nr:BlaI/MecI/CopY family transcriptional regulator [Massilia sp. DJPM01]MDM5176350.1 BlaI/MecI/CopY family transcriptional regulator [Massilia sp. DJPM01]